MTSVTEKELDRLLDEAFKNNTQFCEWFLSKTKFARHGGQDVECIQCSWEAGASHAST